MADYEARHQLTTRIYDRIADPVIQNDEVMKLYSELAPVYDQNELNLFDPSRLPVHDVTEMFAGRPDVRLVDVGAGTGLVGRALQAAGFRNVDALDGSPEMLQVAKEKGLYANYICALVNEHEIQQIQKATYDAVVCVGSFSQGHLNHTSLLELIRITKPGGYVFISMNRKRMLDSQELTNHLEQTMQRHHDDGRWEWLKNETFEPYRTEGSVGLYYTFRVK